VQAAAGPPSNLSYRTGVIVHAPSEAGSQWQPLNPADFGLTSTIFGDWFVASTASAAMTLNSLDTTKQYQCAVQIASSADYNFGTQALVADVKDCVQQ
jgi:hypothetical protein